MTNEPESGVFVVDKPSQMSSQRVVTVIKRRFDIAKAGHAGTLDPMATGALVVGVGRATRMLGYIAGCDKQYEATIRLGRATVTDDADGDFLGDAVDATGLDDSRIAAAMARYVGEIDQIPSAVSAIKVNGQRAYARVRAGEDVTLKARRVTVDRFELLERRDADGVDAGGCVDVDVVVDCSSGTYIRALARDVGRDLGVGGHLTALRRTRVGRFDAPVPLDDLAWDDAEDLATAARATFTTLTVDEKTATDVSYGRPLPLVVDADPTAILSPSGQMMALYRPEDGRSVPVAVLAPALGRAHDLDGS